MFCTQTFESAAAKDDHILEHFAQETCNECQQNLIRIGGNLYVLHNAATCIREYDYDNENYYDDVSSKLATVLVEGYNNVKQEPNNEQQMEEESRLNENDALEVNIDDAVDLDEGGWFKCEPNSEDYENHGNTSQEEEGAGEEEYATNTSTAESTMDEDSQQQDGETNTTSVESVIDGNLPHEAMDLSKSTEIDIKSEMTGNSQPNTNDNEKPAKKEENKRECELCGEFFHKYALYRHRRDVHNPTVCVCQICHTQFKSEEYLQRHMRYKHGATAKLFKCDQCQATFRKEDLFRIHQCNGTSNVDGKMTKCETCGKEFSRKQTLLKHQVLVHSKPDEMIYCKACARVFSNAEERDTHQLECAAKKYQQLASNPVACEICGQIFSRSFSLERHKASKH